jgi:aryl-alcohol dehydrogenase-like predicted oxidoreductase
VNQTLKNLDIEKIDVLQLWGGNEVFDSLDQESQLFADLQALKDAGKINTFLPQLYYTQTIELAKRNIALAPIAFYGSPFGIDISPDALDKTNLAGSVAMHIHGGGDFATVPVFISELQKRNWYLLKNELSKSTFSLAYLSSLGFVSKVVGSTRNNAHFDEVVQFFRSKNTLAATDKILTQQVAIQNCRTDNEGPTNVGNTWPVRQRGIRARITYLRYLGAFHAAKHKRLHNYLKALKIIPMILPH